MPATKRPVKSKLTRELLIFLEQFAVTLHRPYPYMCKHMYRYGKEKNTRVIQLPYALRATVNYRNQASPAGTVAREPTTIYSALIAASCTLSKGAS